MNFLSLMLIIPLIGIIGIIFFAGDNEEQVKKIALAAVVINFLIAILLILNFNPQTSSMQFVENYSWIKPLGIRYHLGVDGISILLVLLTTILSTVTLAYSWSLIKERVKEYYIFLLMLEVGALGVFVSLDFFLFYLFWEVVLLPMYFLIGIWGGKQRIYATTKFFLYTLAGSLLMLVGIIALYLKHYSITGILTFDVVQLAKVSYPASFQFWIFLSFFIAFAIKVPIFPFHTWLPDAYGEAPMAGTVLLSGVLAKMGSYGFLRFGLSILPEASHRFMPLVLIGVLISIIYCGLVAMVQQNLKRLIAYSSICHLGLIVLGIFTLEPRGIEGAIIQMFNHGCITGALFLAVGMLYNRTQKEMIADFGGLSKQVPIFAFFFGFFVLASIGLPGLSGFVGEFMILLGAFKVSIILGLLAGLGILIGIAYMLWMFQRVILGHHANPKYKNLKDLNKNEVLCLLPLLAFVVWVGVYPVPFINLLRETVRHLLMNFVGM